MYMPLRITKQRCSSKNHVTFSHYFGERRTFSGPSPAIPMSYLALVGAPAEKSRSQAGSWVSRPFAWRCASRAEVPVPQGTAVDGTLSHLKALGRGGEDAGPG